MQTTTGRALLLAALLNVSEGQGTKPYRPRILTRPVNKTNTLRFFPTAWWTHSVQALDFFTSHNRQKHAE